MRVRGWVLVLLCLAATRARADKPSPPFDPQAFPSKDFVVTRSSFPFGPLTIQVTQAKRKNEPLENVDTHYCGAWVEIRRATNVLHRVAWPDAEPVGYSYGVFVPSQQPSAKHFLIQKLGDYDGRSLLVLSDGTVVDFVGGRYFVTTDRRYLITEWASDEPGLAVYDLALDKLVLQTKAVPHIHQWYEDDRGYFFTESVWEKEARASESRKHAFRLDLKTANVTSEPWPSGRPSRAVQMDFDPRKLPNCTTPKP